MKSPDNARIYVEQEEYSLVAGGSANLYSHYENQYGDFSES